MRKVFNMGIGIAMVVHQSDTGHLLKYAQGEKITAAVIGEIR
jgi:phosphoribosylaminoimidazole (AIR) synthetase